VDAETQARIAELRQQWKKRSNQEARARREQATSKLRVLTARAKRALESGWEPKAGRPCDCDEFLSNILEGRLATCSHYDGWELEHFLAQEGY
jgi:hypothetical protein